MPDPDQRVLIEFSGGDWDGKTLDSDSQDESERFRVRTILAMTNNGTVGRAFHGLSMAAGEMLRRGEASIKKSQGRGPRPMHRYTVTGRLDEGNETLIRIRHDVELPTWSDLKGAAVALNLTEQGVLDMEARGEIGTRMSGRRKVYHLDYAPKRTPVFLPDPSK